MLHTPVLHAPMLLPHESMDAAGRFALLVGWPPNVGAWVGQAIAGRAAELLAHAPLRVVFAPSAVDGSFEPCCFRLLGGGWADVTAIRGERPVVEVM
mmetsp:Transcript_43685/g.87442  ORF Transcript_43685/g.87442 Transcript_43685/m.87442 type:complete len:97 (-) Transcript_43685:21-311(-)